MTNGKGLPFIKLVGTGNDFLFLDFRALAPTTSLTRKELTARIAHRQTGVGSDGVIFVDFVSKGSGKLKWDFYNPDGSSAEMCGNALRCMGKWTEIVMGLGSVTFETARGDVTVSRVEENYAAELNFIDFAAKPLHFELAGVKHVACLINTGVPHAVMKVTSIDDRETMAEVIKALRFHGGTGERGANVTFLEERSAGTYRTVTFERGVEGYTLSCGTGVLAAAAYGLSVGDKNSVARQLEAEMETPGGKLKVLFKAGLAAVHLIGAADVVCTGLIDERYLR